jgi:COP9 signalosome complex subunit 6
MSGDEANSLISTLRTSESSPQVQLHPLVLLTISDYTTRHTLREQEGPIVGAILGQQHGREVSMEVAFECKVVQNEAQEIVLDELWFRDRLDECEQLPKERVTMGYHSSAVICCFS